MQVVMYLIRMQAHVKTYVTSSCSDASSDVLDTNASCDVLDLPLRHPLPLPFLSLSVCGFLSTPCSCLSRSPPTCCSLTLDSLSLVASPLPFFSPSLSLCHIAPPPLTRPRSHPPPRYAASSSSSSSPKSSSLRLSLSRSLSLCLLECIELSSMVDFSMGTINSMVGYMTSGHGPLHVPRVDSQLKPTKSRAVACWSTRRRTTERTHAGAGSRRHPDQGARPQQSKAVVVHGRVGAGIKGVQPPLCVKRVRGFQCRCARRHQQPAKAR